MARTTPAAIWQNPLPIDAEPYPAPCHTGSGTHARACHGGIGCYGGSGQKGGKLLMGMLAFFPWLTVAAPTEAAGFNLVPHRLSSSTDPEAILLDAVLSAYTEPGGKPVRIQPGRLLCRRRTCRSCRPSAHRGRGSYLGRADRVLQHREFG
jgi:hypothetical protein